MVEGFVFFGLIQFVDERGGPVLGRMDFDQLLHRADHDPGGHFLLLHLIHEREVVGRGERALREGPAGSRRVELVVGVERVQFERLPHLCEPAGMGD